MIKTEFMELYEELNNINEDIDPIASRKFWAAAKNGKIDEEAFHTAFDADLAELGLTDVFTEDGRLTGKDVYGKIKATKEANPDSWAVKALSKLWALRYVDNVLFTSEKAEKAASIEADKKRREEERAEKERLAKEECEALTQEYKALLPEALKLVDPDLLARFVEAYGITDADIDVEVILTNDKALVIKPSTGLGWAYPALKRGARYDAAGLAAILNDHFEIAIKRAEDKKTAEKLDSNKAIDVFNTNQRKKDTSCRAILIGESGTMYQLTTGSIIYKTDKLLGKVEEVKYLADITEPYKVIFTEVHQSSNNYSTRSDSVSYTYYSWDSSNVSKLAGLIPEIGEGEETWSYWETEVVESGNGIDYSIMDNIDSWARMKYTSIATD